MSCCGIRCEAKIQQHSWTLAEPHQSPTNKPATAECLYRVWGNPRTHPRLSTRSLRETAARTNSAVEGWGRDEIEIEISEDEENEGMKYRQQPGTRDVQ